RIPARPSSPNLVLFLSITLFVSAWLAVGIAFGLESFRASAARVIFAVVAITTCALGSQAQAPTPNTSGLPSGVGRIPQSRDTRSAPNPKEAPATWNGANATPTAPTP